MPSLSLIRKGFTLIELLIVVAIIAILAAIAVPNFLEAQTRSKVSRTLADMRSMATAIEAYFVDTNRYMPDAQAGAKYTPYLPRLTYLTTPVAFLTSIPEDVFAAAAVNKSTTLDDPYRVPYGTGELARPFPFDYACRINQAVAGGLEDPTFTGVWARISANSGVLWALRSVGPDNEATFLGGTSSFPASPQYDPTNGTLSRGDIYFTGPGIGIDKPRI